MAFSTFNSFNSLANRSIITKLINFNPLMIAVGGGGGQSAVYIINSTDDGLTWGNNTGGNQVCSTLTTKQYLANTGSHILFFAKLNMWMACITGNYMYSYDNGVTWTVKSLNFTIYSIKTNGNILIACGFNPQTYGQIWYSYDGIIWTITNVNYGSNWNTATFCGTKWLTVGNNVTGQNLLGSADGITWNHTNISGDSMLSQGYTVTYNGSIYLAGGLKNTQTMISSTDSLTWTSVTSATAIATQSVYSIAWNGAKWVAIGITTSNAGVVMYSSDGINWFRSTSGSNYMTTYNTSCKGVVLWDTITNTWIVGGSNSSTTTSCIINSTDGITWYASTNSNILGVNGCSSIGANNI
jgi:hypothetical protein